MFFVALGGWLNRWSVLLLTVTALGAFALAFFVARSGKPGTDAASDLGGRFAPDTRYAVAAIAAALVPAFVWTLYPPTAYDAIDFTVPTAVVLGSEGPGLRRLVRERCDHLASIPMHGHVGSLNVSVAAGIVLFEAIRQRRKKS